MQPIFQFSLNLNFSPHYEPCLPPYLALSLLTLSLVLIFPLISLLIYISLSSYYRENVKKCIKNFAVLNKSSTFAFGFALRKSV